MRRCAARAQEPPGPPPQRRPPGAHASRQQPPAPRRDAATVADGDRGIAGAPPHPVPLTREQVRAPARSDLRDGRGAGQPRCGWPPNATAARDPGRPARARSMFSSGSAEGARHLPRRLRRRSSTSRSRACMPSVVVTDRADRAERRNASNRSAPGVSGAAMATRWPWRVDPDAHYVEVGQAPADRRHARTQQVARPAAGRVAHRLGARRRRTMASQICAAEHHELRVRGSGPRRLPRRPDHSGRSRPARRGARILRSLGYNRGACRTGVPAASRWPSRCCVPRPAHSRGPEAGAAGHRRLHRLVRRRRRRRQEQARSQRHFRLRERSGNVSCRRVSLNVVFRNVDTARPRRRLHAARRLQRNGRPNSITVRSQNRLHR